MTKYSTISVPRELHDELQHKVKNNPRLGYSSIAEFCKEAIRVHLSNIRMERREAFLQRIDLNGLLRKVELTSTVGGGEYRDMFENCMDPAFVVGPDGILLNVNRELVDRLGYNTKEDLLGRDLAVMFADNRALNDMMALARQGGIRDFEIKMQRRDGKPLDFVVSIGMVTHDGDILRYYGSAKDITVRKLAESRLKREHELYSRILDQMYDSVVVIQDEKVKYAAGQHRASGYTPEEITGMRLNEFIVEKDVKKAQEVAKKRLAGEDVPPIHTYRVKCRHGGTNSIEVSSQVIDWEGRPAFLCVIRYPGETKCGG
ncbi:MAG: PAS domain S-box protein [Thermoplasmatota archaeon]